MQLLKQIFAGRTHVHSYAKLDSIALLQREIEAMQSILLNITPAPIPQFEAVMSGDFATPASGGDVIPFDTLHEDHNSSGFSVVTYTHKPTVLEGKDLWHYNIAATRATVGVLNLVVTRDDLATVVRQSLMDSTLTNNLSFALAWSDTDDPITVIVITFDSEDLLHEDNQTIWDGYRVGQVEPAPPTGQNGTVDMTIDRSEGDGHEDDNGGQFTFTGTTLKVEPSTTASSRFNACLWWEAVGIPQGAIIDDATLYVTFPAVQRDSPRLRIYGNLVPSANDLSVEQDVTSRARTTEYVAWSGDNLGAGSPVASPDFANVVQELVDQGTWDEDSNLAIICVGDNVAGPEATRFTPYDNVPADACRIVINWHTT